MYLRFEFLAFELRETKPWEIPTLRCLMFQRTIHKIFGIFYLKEELNLGAEVLNLEASGVITCEDGTVNS